MEFEDFGARFSVAVEDFSGSWSLLQETLQGRGPLRHVTLRNKFGNPVPITELPIQFLLSTDSKLQNIKPFQGSPVTWFRNPYARLILVSGEDADDYKRTLRAQLKALIEREKDPLGPTEWVVCYIKPAASDPLSKGPRKVFDALRHDFNTRRRERCVRLDFPVQQGQGSIAGLEDLEQLLKAAVKSSFETRAAAYEEEVRKLMARRLEPGWNFSTLYLIKDSLAIMLEAAGLLEDAFREYFELEACYLEALKQGGNLAGRHFGGKTDGDDAAQILKAAWRETRSSVMRGNGVAEFYFRQYLFACQARLLFKLNRPTEVAERGLQFVHNFVQLLAEQQAAAELPQLFREAWAFSACISLATTTSRLMGVAAVLNKQAPAQPDSPAEPPQAHRRSASLREVDGAEVQRHVSRSLSAGDLAQDQSSRRSADGAAQHRSTVDASELQQGPALKPLKINKNNFAGLEAQGMIAQLSVPNQDKQSGDVQEAATPHMRMEVDWDLGVSGHSDGMLEEDEDTSLWSRTPSAIRKPPIPHQAYYCLLGHLYAAARLELMRMGHTLNLSQHTPAGPAHGNGASPTASRLSSQHASHSSTPAHTFNGMSAAPTPSMLPKLQHQDQQQQPSQQNGVQVVQEAAPAASTDLGTASSLNAAVSAASSRRPALQSTSSKKLSRFAVESQRLPPTEGLPPLAPATPLATPMATRGDSVTSQVTAAPGASPARTTTDEGDDTSSNDGSMHRSEVDYSTLARAEAAAQQQDSTSGHVGGGDAPPGVLQRSRPLPSSSDAGHLALAAQQAGDVEADGDGNSQGDWSVATTQRDSKDSALEGVARGGPDKGLESAGSAVPTWLSDWRLKLALGSWQLYQELWMELSGAAAACYTKCGRKRNGTLMQADIADALIARGNTARAAMVLQRQARLFMREGWWDLAAAVLQRLLQCQKLLMQAVLPATCLQLLGLPQHVRRKLDADGIQADLLQAAAQPSFNHPSFPLFAPQHNPSARCHAGSAMYLRPVEGCSSLFSGQTGPDGQPLLNPNQLPPGHTLPEPMQGAERLLNQTLPSHQPGGQPSRHSRRPQQKGALDICVGDAVSLTVQLHCALPHAVDLRNVVLTLALLQEVTVAYSPKSATSSKADFSTTTSSLKQRMGTDSPHAPGSPTPPSGDPAAAADDADVTTQWQETEELACSWSTSAAQSSESPRGVGNTSASHQRLPGDTVTLQPGLNMITFRVLPLKRGLYTLKHMQGSLGSLSLHIPVILKEPTALALHSQAAAEQPPIAPTAASDPHNPQAAALGTVLHTGDLQQEAVVLQVHSCRQRLAVSAAALKGTLVAGQPQWLAVVIMPLHDALHEACVHMGMASRAATGLEDAAGSSSLGASLGSSGRSPGAGYEDGFHPSHSPSLDVLHADRAVLAPLQVPSHSQAEMASALPGAHPAGDEASRAPASLQRQQAQTAFPEEAPLAGSVHAQASEESLLRHDAGAEASVSGSSWVSMEGSQGPNLPAWTATRPSLLWVWVRPGLLPLQHETVRVTPNSMRGFGRVVGGDDVGAFASPRAACPQPSGAVNVQVNVEYFQGCQRAHAAWLTIPITPVFRLHTTARELPMKRVAIQVTIASNLPWPVTLTALTLAPQHGFRLDPSMGLVNPLCPLTLHPSSTASALLFVTTKSGGRSASRGHMLPGGAAQVCTLDIQYKVESQAAPSSPVSEVVSEYSKRLLDDATVPQPPSGPPVQQAAAEGEEVNVQHIFSLVMAPVEGTPRSTVYIRLLGPFSARVGEAVTLCWQLERSPGAASGHDTNTVQYEVAAMADGWRPSGVRAGCVGLSAEGGTATIEASWVPITAGTLPAPELHLRDLSHQEAFDVGANTEFINVLPL